MCYYSITNAVQSVFSDKVYCKHVVKKFRNHSFLCQSLLLGITVVIMIHNCYLHLISGNIHKAPNCVFNVHF